MAVATDSHRDFLIPEHTVFAVCPTTDAVSTEMNCVILLSLPLYYKGQNVSTGKLRQLHIKRAIEVAKFRLL